jgi:hypothetical protein
MNTRIALLLAYVNGMLMFALQIAKSDEAELSKSLPHVIHRHRGEFLDLISRSKAQPLETAQPQLTRLLAEFDDKSSSTGAKDLLAGLVAVSLNADGGKPPLRRISEHSIVEALLAGLCHADASVRQIALLHLSQHCAPAQYRSKAELLIQARDLNSDDQLLRLIGLTDSTEGRRLIVQLSTAGISIPNEVRARNGDKAIEQTLIRRFRDETNSATKARLALDLGYVASPACIYALASELRSRMIVDEQHYAYSVRYRILEALGNACPNEGLFNEELYRVVDGPSYGLPVDGEAYIDRVEAWCVTTFNMQWSQQRPSFLLWKRKPIPRPLPDSR